MTTPEAPPIDLRAEIVRSIAAPLEEALRARGVEVESLTLAAPTREGAGDLALPCHPFARALRTAPQRIAEGLIEAATGHPLVASASATAGFLNLELDWATLGGRVVEWALSDRGALGRSGALEGRRVEIEYSSPNTNKPMHLGHCRNNILGATVANLLAAAGAHVIRVNLVNDRGIHICKSMVAYRRFGQGVTPASAGVKGDHLVGDFYVRFEQAFARELDAAGTGESREAFFNGASELGGEARRMLKAWEAGDPDVRALWQTMNAWCHEGFEATYRRMGVAFDRIDLESETYLLGKDLVSAGLASGLFQRRVDGPVVFDLSRIGLEGEKVVLRSDGTSTYTTQDLGTAVMRYERDAFDRLVYVVGNEQDRHFQVLFGILGQLQPDLDGRLEHLSYGMVELPDGKMKSREGTVVDADELMDELHQAARRECQAKWPELAAEEAARRAEAIGLAGLRFFLLKFAPQTNFTFDPARSVALEGETGAYCQYAFARACSLLSRVPEGLATPDHRLLSSPHERALMGAMLAFPGEICAAALQRKPSLLTAATFELAKTLARFYANCRVINAEPPPLRAARVDLVRAARRVIGAGLELMGIEALEQM